jgi:predicted Zn-dependent protease
MDAGNLNPSSMITVLDKIQKGNWYDTNKLPSYLLTHPTGPERMANLDSLLSGYTPKTPGKEMSAFRKNFPYFKAILRVKNSPPHETREHYKNELSRNPDSLTANFGMGLLLQERSNYDQAVKYFQRAHQLDPESILIMKHLAEAYTSNDQPKEGMRLLEKLYKENHQESSVLYLLAKSYQDLEEYAKAIPLYEKLLATGSVREEVYHNIGVCYGRENRLPLAHYYFGIYFKQKGNLGKADFHFNKAESLSGSDPVLKAKIQKARKELFKK